jgi:Gpi18-like mannosyltransferase
VIVASFGERRVRLWLASILVVGLAIRLALTPFGVHRGDALLFEAWAIRLVRLPTSRFYATKLTTDHLPGDLWFLWAIAHLYRLFSPEMAVTRFGFLFLLKLVPALADVGIGLVLFLIARLFAGPRTGLIAAACFVLNPASIFLTATWGQWDSVSAFFMVVALLFLLRGAPEWSLPFLTYASLIKPQLAALFPLVALAWLRWAIFPPGDTTRAFRVPRSHRMVRAGLGVASVPIIFSAVVLPFDVGVPPLSTRWTILDRVQVALDRFKATSLNAYNLWSVLAHGTRSRRVPDSRTFLLGLSYRQWGIGLLALAMLTVFALFWLRPSRAVALWAAFATMLSLFVLPTRVHERYLFPAFVLAVLGAVVIPALRWIGALLSLTYFANLVVVYAASRKDIRLDAIWTNRIVLATATLNLFLLLAVFTAGVSLVRSPLVVGARVRWRQHAIGGAIAAAILAAALVTGSAQGGAVPATTSVSTPAPSAPPTGRATPQTDPSPPPNRSSPTSAFLRPLVQPALPGSQVTFRRHQDILENGPIL